MQWLTALLAFATTMLVFAIIVSTLVELIHRAFRLRGRGMHMMLENLYIRVIDPRLSDDQKGRISATEFAAIIMENRAIAPHDGSEQTGRIRNLFHRLVDASTMTDIPVEVFTQKLADSRIVGNAENFTDAVLRDIAQKYESYGHEISTWFARRARVFSVGVALVVVWLFHVHPYNLAVAYLTNPVIAERVAAQAGETYREYETLANRLAVVEGGDELGEEDSRALRQAIDGLQLGIDQAREENSRLRGLGVPVGWPDADTMIATCLGRPEAVASTGDDQESMHGYCRVSVPGLRDPVTLPSPGNTLWLIFGGLLVGLGAPFWAQAVSSLAATRDLSRRIGRAVGADSDDSTSSGSGARGMSATSDTPAHVKTFLVARTQQRASPGKEPDGHRSAYDTRDPDTGQ